MVAASLGIDAALQDYTTHNFRGPYDLWGIVLTPEVVNSAAFPLRLMVKRLGTLSRTVQVNGSEVKVHHAVAASHRVGQVAAEVLRTAEAAGGHRLGYVVAEVLQSAEMRRRRRAVVMVCG